MTIYFQSGDTAHEALSKFFEVNKELQEEIIQLTTPQ
jgi:hypothetical protein